MGDDLFYSQRFMKEDDRPREDGCLFGVDGIISVQLR